jgi:endonuclease/exonuclease/phosphatase (EEP) superfamily protein YafD
LLGPVLASAPREPAARPVLRVVSINAFHDNPDPSRLVETVKRERPDILLVQEADGSAGAAILRILPGYSRVWSCNAAPCSLAIFSRWPVARIEARRQDSSLPDLLVARTRAPFGDIDVATLHLPRMNRAEAEPFAAMSVDALSALGDLPLLMGGDFNLPTGSFALARFERLTGLSRAERWIPTYPADRPLPPIAAIDHVYVSEAWRVKDCHRLAATASDHFGLSCEVALRSAWKEAH